MEYEHVVHEIKPVFDENSRVLILGTLPSPKSREASFYYGHVRNRFWSVLSAVFDEDAGQSIEEKTAFLKRHSIALWDTIYECDINGAADNSIKNPVPTDLGIILKAADIKMIFTTGKTAYKYYKKYHEAATGIKAICLPSTSPANARRTLEDLIDEYKIIKNFL